MTVGSSAVSSTIFAPDEFGPLTGRRAEDCSLQSIARVADLIVRYDRIHVQTSRHAEVEAYYDRVLALGAASAGRPQLGGRVLGPSGSGKTTAARHFKAEVESRGLHEEGQIPVLIVALDRAATAKRFFSSILRTVGDGFYEKGTEEQLQKRAYEALRRFGVRLLVVDETQHLRFRSTERNDTTDTLKRVLDDAICPIVFAGTEDAADFLRGNKQLANRLHPPCDLLPLDPGKATDRAVFKDYVDKLDAAMEAAGITARPSNLSDKRVRACLMAVSDGVLGRVSNLIRAALARAAARHADYVEICDLAEATESWAVSQGFIEYNPFTTGVRPAGKLKPDAQAASFKHDSAAG